MTRGCVGQEGASGQAPLFARLKGTAARKHTPTRQGSHSASTPATSARHEPSVTEDPRSERAATGGVVPWGERGVRTVVELFDDSLGVSAVARAGRELSSLSYTGIVYDIFPNSKGSHVYILVS